MNKHTAITQATEIVKAAVQAGWLKGESGPTLGDHVSAAIEEITKRLLALNAKTQG